MVRRAAVLVSSAAVVLLCVSCTPSSGTAAKAGSAGSSSKVVRTIEKDAKQLLDDGDDFETILDDLAADFPDESSDVFLEVLAAIL